MTAESLRRVRRGKGHQRVTAVCLSGTGPLQQRGRPQGPLGGGCPGPRWLAETAAAAGCDGDGAGSLSPLWAAGHYVSSGGGAPRRAAPPPGQKWRRCRWQRRWCWGSSAGGSPAWQSPAPELLQRTGGKRRISWRWSREGDDGARVGGVKPSSKLWHKKAKMQTLPQSREWIRRTNAAPWSTHSRSEFHVQSRHTFSKRKGTSRGANKAFVSGKKPPQLTAVFDKAADERRRAGEDRRQKPSQITMFVAGDETEELKVPDDSCGQRLDTQQPTRCLKWQKEPLRRQRAMRLIIPNGMRGIVLEHFRWLIREWENFNQALGVRLLHRTKWHFCCLLVHNVSTSYCCIREEGVAEWVPFIYEAAARFVLMRDELH